MLMQLVYCSRPTMPSTDLIASLAPLNAANKNKDITGLIVTCDNFIIQAIEGHRTDVNELYARIVKDSRHTDVTLLRYNTITSREFGSWHLVHTNLQTVISEYINIIITQEDLTTESITGVKALTLLRHMSARLKVYDEKGH